MIIKQTNLNIVYPKINDYRKKFVLGEEILKDYFLEATILPVPEQVQEDVPRIMVQSQNGHSVLSIALNVTSFGTNYDEEYSLDWKQCSKYLKERSYSVYGIVDILTNNNNIFVGLIANVEIDDFAEDGIDVIKKSLLVSGDEKFGEIYDLGMKLTYVYEERYYVNITIENIREFDIEQSDAGKSYFGEEKRHSIGVTIDINDRYAANHNATYVSGRDAFNDILNVADKIIGEKLITLLREGTFEL